MFFDENDISRLLPGTSPLQTSLITIESGALARLDEYLARVGAKRPMTAVYDTNTYEAAAGRRPAAEREVVLPAQGLHADERAVAALLGRLDPDTATIISVGSGTIHDVSRYCAFKLGATLISCPTAASVDGFCSNVAAMTWHGSKKTLAAVAPAAVVADTDIIAAAPARLAKSGVGDILGKYTALADWKIGAALTGERYDGTIAATTKSAVDIVRNGAQGILRGDPAAHESLCYALLLSGLAMQAFGNSRPASGAEHHISHLIEMSPSPLGLDSRALHGEKVGVGTLIVAERYRRLAKKRAEDIVYRAPAADEASLAPDFGELTGAVLEENARDCSAGLSTELIRARWDEICAAAAEIPPAEELRGLYRELGLLSTLADIGVEQSREEQLFRLSPLVRNRLTLARVMRGITLKG